MSKPTYAPEGYAFYSVIGTNGFATEHMLPMAEESFTTSDHRKMRELERSAELTGTAIRCSTYALL